MFFSATVFGFLSSVNRRALEPSKDAHKNTRASDTADVTETLVNESEWIYVVHRHKYCELEGDNNMKMMLMYNNTDGSAVTSHMSYQG